MLCVWGTDTGRVTPESRTGSSMTQLSDR
jgi:hypothetical protein